MDTEFKNILTQLCLELICKLERKISHIPYGSCYLLGHCLAEGFSRSGLKAREVTGNLILQDKHRKSIVYGKSNYHGKLVGYFHTWCNLTLEEELIVDPSIKYIKMYLKKYCNIKLNERLPDILISNENHLWYYEYIEDKSLIPQSKFSLNKVDPKLLSDLVKDVEELSNFHFITRSSNFRKSA